MLRKHEDNLYGGRLRSHPVHLPVHQRGDRPAIVLLTVNTRKRRPLLANTVTLHSLIAAWAQAGTWQVGRYVILPDHLHLFCSPGENRVSLVRWVAYWKALVTRTWPRPSEKPIWQAHFWDRQLRSGDSYQEKWEYVRQNPVRRGLVERADDWPFAGEICSLPWIGD